ncbi:hypothetical protein AAVH_12162 [Aphelenchoides avenae]|nr:hypothetical protein AAVH_12162 [Aphelenchus avenae]
MLPPEKEASASPGKQYRAGRPRPEGRAPLPVPPPREPTPEVRGTPLMLLRRAHTNEFEERWHHLRLQLRLTTGLVRTSKMNARGTVLMLPRRVHTKEFQQTTGTVRVSDCGPLLLSEHTRVHGMALVILRRIHSEEYEEFQQTTGTARVSDCGPSLLSGATCDDGWRAPSSVVESN